MCWSLDPQLGPPFSHAIGFTYTTTMLHRKLRDSLRWTITREAWVIYIYIYMFCFVSELIISWTNKAISLFFKSTMVYLFVPQLHLYDPVRWSFLFSSRHFFCVGETPFFVEPTSCFLGSQGLWCLLHRCFKAATVGPRLPTGGISARLVGLYPLVI